VESRDKLDVTPDERWLSDIFSALGNPVRLRILRHLANEACVCGKIVELLPLAQSTVSQHLKVLRTAGLIKGIVDGPYTCYCVDREQIVRLKELVAQF
jgi:DNA-binding transcriptional ArsR family regulator